MELIGRTINGRFRLLEIIAGNTFSRIYRADDGSTGGKAIVILVNRSESSGRLEDVIRFKFDAAASLEFRHPHIVRLVEAGESFEHQYLAVEDRPWELLSAALASREFTLDACIDMMIQLCRGLEYAHERGVLHCAVKPEYITVNGSDAALYGFGLSHIIEYRDASLPGGIDDIIGYISPEQTGMVKRSVSERSDLYSLGVLFYRLAAGRLPFSGSTISSIVYKHITAMPEAPSKIRREIPGIVSDVILKLLEKEPENRYQSARGLRADLERIRGGAAAFAPGGDDRAGKIDYRTRLVGREREFELLREIYHESRKEGGKACFITSEAGIGKTRLIEEMKNHVYSTGGVFISGRCISGENKQPYFPVRDAVDSYLKIFETYPEPRRDEIRRIILADFPDLGSIVSRINPRARVIFGESRPLADVNPERDDRWFHGAAARFFHLIASAERDFVVAFDDAHWIDDGSLEVLSEVVAGSSPFPMLIIAAFREDETGPDHGLMRLARDLEKRGIPVEKVRPQGFDAATMSQFVAAMITVDEKNNRRLSEYLVKRSAGNPLFALELIQQLVEEKAIARGKAGWTIDWTGLERIQARNSVVGVIIGRIGALDASERMVLSLAAVIGKKFSQDLLFKISDASTEEIVRTVDRAVTLNLVEAEVQERGSLMFVHDRIREALLRELDGAERKRLHRAIAAVMETEYAAGQEELIFELAHHAIEGDDRDLVVRYAFPAGRLAREACAYENATSYFRTAISSLEQGAAGADDLLDECRYELGSVYVTTGEYDRALAIFSSLIDGQGDTMRTSRILMRICDAYYRKGDWERCEEFASRGLALLGVRIPRSDVRFVRGILLGLATHVLHLAFPFLFVRRSAAPREGKYPLIGDFFEPLGMAYSLNSPLKLVWADITMMNILERGMGPSPVLAKAYLGFALVHMSVPFFSHSKKYHDKSLEMNNRLGYDWGRAKNYEFLGYYHEWRGNFDAGEESFSTGLEICKRLGDIKERGMLLNGLEHCHYYRGDYSSAKAVNDSYYKSGSDAGDDYAVTAADIYYAQIYRECGDLERAERHARASNERSRERKIWFNYCSSLIEMGCNALERGNARNAIEYLESAMKLHGENSFLKQYVVHGYCYLAEAYIEDFIRNGHLLPREDRKKYRAKIESAVRRALKKTGKWATHYGIALRVAGLWRGICGSGSRAVHYLSASVSHHSRTGRKFELARGLYEYGLHLSQAGERERSREKMEKAYLLFRETGALLYVAKVRVLLGIRDDEEESSPIMRLIKQDQLSTMRHLLRGFGIMRDMGELADAVLAQAMELTGSRSGCLFLRGTDGAAPELRAARTADETLRIEYSEAMVERVWETGETQLAGPDVPGRREAAAALCVPVAAGESLLGVCYVELVRPGSEFTEKDADVLSTFITQAALAIQERLSAEKAPEDRNDDRESVLTPGTEEKIKTVIDYIHANYMYDISREGLSTLVNASPNHLGKFFKIYTGKKIGDYINECRVRHAMERFASTDDSVIDIAYSVGFESLRTFNRAFSRETNVTPTAYRTGVRRRPSAE